MILTSISTGKLLKEKIKSTQSSLAAGYERAAMRYPKEMLDLIREARREKVRNRTREHERVRRGFVSKAVLRRSRKGPPAHILVKMTDWERRADQISRGVSEVGYVGMIKAQLGMKLKDPNRWKELEEGREEDRGNIHQLANLSFPRDLEEDQEIMHQNLFFRKDLEEGRENLRQP